MVPIHTAGMAINGTALAKILAALRRMKPDGYEAPW